MLGERGTTIHIRAQHQPWGDIPEYHEWINTGERLRLDSMARDNPRLCFGGATWTKWICNNSDCPAEAVVADQFIQTRLYGIAPDPPAAAGVPGLPKKDGNE